MEVSPVQELTSETPPSSAQVEETSSTGTKDSKPATDVIPTGVGAGSGLKRGGNNQEEAGGDSARREKAALAAMAAQRYVVRNHLLMYTNYSFLLKLS